MLVGNLEDLCDISIFQKGKQKARLTVILLTSLHRTNQLRSTQ